MSKKKTTNIGDDELSQGKHDFSVAYQAQLDRALAKKTSA